MLNADELVAVDDFRFKKRMPSRASAVRELLKRGLAAEGFALATVGAKIIRIRRDRQNPFKTPVAAAQSEAAYAPGRIHCAVRAA